MFTMSYWQSELAEFDGLLQAFLGDAARIDLLCRGLTFLAAAVNAQNGEHREAIVEATVSRLISIQEIMGLPWFLARVVEVSVHAMPA